MIIVNHTMMKGSSENLKKHLVETGDHEENHIDAGEILKSLV